MKLSHFRSPSDPGPIKTRTADAVSHDNVDDEHFLVWLKSLTNKYKNLSEGQRQHTLNTLVSISGWNDIKYLSDLLPNILYRDFIRLLPDEVGVKILLHLDEKSLLNCCLVNKYWLRLMNSYKEIWINMARRVGVVVEQQPTFSTKMCKAFFIKSANMIQKMKNRSAFVERYHDEHRSRVTAVHYRNGQLATGSDDHTVRVWDVETFECLSLIHTHTVYSLRLEEDLVFTTSCDTTAACWDMWSLQLVVRYIGHTSAVTSLDIKRTENILVTGSADKTVKVWQLSSGALHYTLTGWHNDWVTSVKILSVLTENEDVLQKLHCVSGDKQGSCFWTLDEQEKVEGTATHLANWCASVPCVTAAVGGTVSLCTWNQTTQVLAISSYSANIEDNKCEPKLVSFLTLPKVIPPRQTVLGIGKKFAVFIVDTEYSSVVIVDIVSERVLCSIPIKPYCKVENGATLGNYDWLDGFTNTNRTGLFLAASLKDNTILQLTWKSVNKLLT